MNRKEWEAFRSKAPTELANFIAKNADPSIKWTVIGLYIDEGEHSSVGFSQNSNGADIINMAYASLRFALETIQAGEALGYSLPDIKGRFLRAMAALQPEDVN
jgi:hypothetical protein